MKEKYSYIGEVHNTIKDADLFGYTPTLNIKKEGGEYKTIIGGYFSMIIKIGLLFYTYTLVLLIIHRDSDIF